MFQSLSALIFAAVALAVCGFAFAKGGNVERWFAAIYILSWFASLVVQTQAPPHVFPWALFAIDAINLALFAVLVWRSHATWLIWATALQTLAVASHFMNLFVKPSTTAFYTVLTLTSYGVLICLGVGTFWAWQERRAAGLE